MKKKMNQIQLIMKKKDEPKKSSFFHKLINKLL